MKYKEHQILINTKPCYPFTIGKRYQIIVIDKSEKLIPYLIRDDSGALCGYTEEFISAHFMPLHPLFDSNEVEQVEVKGDAVNHPSHYTWLKEKCGIEVIDITRHMDFCLGNAVKYILRAGRKPIQSENKSDFYAGTIQDLKKAVWYLNDKIKQLESHE